MPTKDGSETIALISDGAEHIAENFNQKLQDTSETQSSQPAVPAPRKKPTRRGGKRARHRPCHAAAAALEWASSVGSAETPSFGEPASGEEAEGEGEPSEARAEPVVQNRVKEASKASKPRSFYPLAARLRVASAGLKLDANGAADEIHKAATPSQRKAEAIESRTKEAWHPCKDEALDAITHSMDWPKRTIEVIEEVEPEPASASDVSDIPHAAEPGREVAKGVTFSEKLPPARNRQPRAAADDKIVGRRVQITGLVKTPEFNGQWGKVEDFDSRSGRYGVQLLPVEGVPMIVKLRGENLRMPPVLSLRFEGHGHGRKAKKDAWKPSLRLATAD